MARATDDLLAERGKTHGSYLEAARISQQLLEVLRTAPGWHRLKYHHLEAIQMICHKLHRITVGDPDFADHWDDIAGYARLVSKVLAGEYGDPEHIHKLSLTVTKREKHRPDVREDSNKHAFPADPQELEELRNIARKLGQPTGGSDHGC